MMETPWWAWLFLLPIWLQLLAMGFVLLIGHLTYRSTGSYPTLAEWCTALLLLWARKPPPDVDRPAAGKSDRPIEEDNTDQCTL